MEVVEFLNTLYTVMDKRMDDHDVYKVETISDSYLVVSGVPKVNGDKYESGIGFNLSFDERLANLAYFKHLPLYFF